MTVSLSVCVMSMYYTLCLKKRTNFESVQLKTIRIGFDDIWQCPVLKMKS